MSGTLLTRLAWLLQSPDGHWQGTDGLVASPAEAHRFARAQTAAAWIRQTQQPRPDQWRLIPATLGAHPSQPHQWGLLNLHV